ncbi:hypothetical protein Syun_000217 [Stephania yunnanensis]|uniref:Mitochondrial carrier protein n=1 Tax=Stephania yunnanensis TaxID=152371 RepID=A0AAP0LD70_9MAGN
MLLSMEELLQSNMFAIHAIAAAGSVAIGTSLVHPFDTLKTLSQVSSVSGKGFAAQQVLDRVRSVSGNLGVYSGLGWSALGRVPGLAARFGVFELLSAFYKDGREDKYVYVSEAIFAGIAGGALEAFVNSPFELFKLRSQVSSVSLIQNSASDATRLATSPVNGRLLPGYMANKNAWDNTLGLLSTLRSKHPNMIGALKEYPWLMTGSGKPPPVCDVKRPLDIVSLEGWQALWRGLRAGIARDCIFGGIFFSSWQSIHIAMLDWKAVEMDPPPRFYEEVGPISPLASSLAAGFSGTIAAAISHCFDTAKTRSQCTVIPKYISMERSLLKWQLPGQRFERITGIHPADRSILLRGLWLRMARCGIGSFAIVGGYYFAVDHLMPK